MLDESLTATADHADERVALEGTKDEIEIGGGVDAEAFGPDLDGVDLLGGPSERLGVLAQCADSQRVEGRSVGGIQLPDRRLRVARRHLRGS